MKPITIAVAVLALSAVAVLAVPAVAAPAPQVVRVTERDYAIGLSPAPRAGRVTFVVRNAGRDGHDFWIRGGGQTAKSRVIGAGGTARVTITLKKGVRYTFWCGVGSHARKGMRGSFVAR
jgi:hypothetical protein